VVPELAAEVVPVLLPVKLQALHRTARPDIVIAIGTGMLWVVTIQPVLRVAASYRTTGTLLFSA
jgi:hypothetical protein